jgi:hypothetical protein
MQHECDPALEKLPDQTSIRNEDHMLIIVPVKLRVNQNLRDQDPEAGAHLANHLAQMYIHKEAHMLIVHPEVQNELLQGHKRVQED